MAKANFVNDKGQDDQQKARRRVLRRRQTPAERRLWRALRNRQLDGRKFRRQHGIGPFIVDFFCHEERLVVELDGAVHDDPYRSTYDKEREQYLRTRGYRMLRFQNDQIMEHLEEVLDIVADHFDG